MKYQFIEKDEDTTILKYQDKEFEIKRDVRITLNYKVLINSKLE